MWRLELGVFVRNVGQHRNAPSIENRQETEIVVRTDGCAPACTPPRQRAVDCSARDEGKRCSDVASGMGLPGKTEGPT